MKNTSRNIFCSAKKILIRYKLTDLCQITLCYLNNFIIYDVSCFLVKLWSPPPSKPVCISQMHLTATLQGMKILTCWNATLQVGQSVC